MNGNETYKEQGGLKTTGNLFVYNYILCKFFHGSVSFTFLGDIFFWKFKVLTLKTVNYVLQNLPLILDLGHERCTLSNSVVFLQNSESRNPFAT